MSADPIEQGGRSFFADGLIETIEEASWCGRKLRRHRQTLAEVEALYQAEKERLDRWIEAERSRLGADAARFSLALESWHRRRLMEDPTQKTIRLPAATLKARQQPDRVEVREPEVLIQWAEEQFLPQLVRVKREPARKAIAEYVKDTGEIPVGVEVVPGDVSFTVVTEDEGA